MIKTCEQVHHRTGGLENIMGPLPFRCVVHHRTGGLEMHPFLFDKYAIVHHRTGGLEILILFKFI